MKKKAFEIKAGDILCIEYGAPENYVSFKARAVFATDDKVMVLADSKVGSETFVFRASESVMVVPGV